MKKTAIFNAQLSYAIATLGHTDSLTICDAGLPIPETVERIDLALTKGIPSFMDTVKITLTEMFVERAVIAEEIKIQNSTIHSLLLSALSELEQQQGNKIAIDYVPHEQFKQLSHASKAIVRTGECSPYANVILYSGVPF